MCEREGDKCRERERERERETCLRRNRKISTPISRGRKERRTI